MPPYLDAGHTMSRLPLLLLMSSALCMPGCLLFATPEGDGGGDAPPVDVSVVVFDRVDMGSEEDLAEEIPDQESIDLLDEGDDLLEEEMPPEEITPPGWWDGAWTMRHIVEVKISWPEEVILPVRLSGGASAHAGKELVFLLNDSSEPLLHETEEWSPATENVVWVRFPDGLEAGDRLEVYSHTATAPDKSTERPGELWRGFARHVYHFDDSDPNISYDSVSDAPIHLLKSGGYTAKLPSAKMGRHLLLTEQTPNILSNGTVSPLYTPDDRDTTYEAHFAMPTFIEDATTHRIISEENACFGNSIMIGPNVSFTRVVHGEGCETEGFPKPAGAQTVLHNTYQIDKEYLLFTVMDWTEMTVVTFLNERHGISNILTLPRYTSGERAIPKRMDIAGAPWHDKQIPLAIDTLIIHDRAISREEITLRTRVTHDNASAFEFVTSEFIEDFIVK